jgi:hypothetical protein
LANDSEQDRPPNGHEKFEPRQVVGDGTLTIINGNSEDAAVMISNLMSNEQDRVFYVRARMTATMEADFTGQYSMKFQTGRRWDELHEDFGCASGSWSFDQTASFNEEETATGVQYSDISVTLHNVVAIVSTRMFATFCTGPSG